MRLGNWTPADVQQFVLPQVQQEVRDFQAMEAAIIGVLGECDLTSNTKIIDQLNAE